MRYDKKYQDGEILAFSLSERRAKALDKLEPKALRLSA
ncbi:unnamed protein product, partial [marine sediment metagenome]